MSLRRGVVLSVVLASVATALAAPSPPQDAAPARVPYVDAHPLFEMLRPELLPQELRDVPPAERALRWDAWTVSRDREIRGRMTRGDEDAVVNLLAYGTAFTRQPPFRFAEIPRLLDDPSLVTGRDHRIADLAHALAAPDGDDRIRFVRGVVVRAGIDGADRADVRRYLLAMTARVAEERRRYDAADAAAKASADVSAGLVGRGTLFRDRGLATDTSLFPDHALEEALTALLDEGVLDRAAVRRVAVIGPGLDFADKQDGHDFYPVQTIQPFAIMDSLLRLGLSTAADLQIAAFDLNLRVVEHLAAARRRAEAGESYAVWLPRPAEAWSPRLAAFWERFGGAIGAPAQVPPPATLPPGIRVRVVRVGSDAVMRVTARQLNIVLERPADAGRQPFDLVIATNTLVYYGVFEQGLALANIAAMLRPGGLLLSNDIVVANGAITLAGYTDVPYTAAGDGDRIYWYRRQ
jgi:hypothetical protein